MIMLLCDYRPYNYNIVNKLLFLLHSEVNQYLTFEYQPDKEHNIISLTVNDI